MAVTDIIRAIGDFFRRLFGKNDDPGESGEQATDLAMPVRRVSYGTDQGLVRENNEDSFYADGKCRHVFGESERGSYIERGEQTHVYAVFDGMGGEAYGEAASELSASAFAEIKDTLVSADPQEFSAIMHGYVRRANDLIVEMLHERSAKAGGSTFVSVCVCGTAVYPFYLGDSRLYLIENDVIQQITVDHTVAAAKARVGAEVFRRDHHALTNFLGQDRTGERGIEPAVLMPIPLERGSTLVLCTDGLSDMLTDEEIAAAVKSAPGSPAEELIKQALEHGGRDNVTCIVIEDLKDPPPEEPGESAVEGSQDHEPAPQDEPEVTAAPEPSDEVSAEEDDGNSV